VAATIRRESRGGATLAMEAGRAGGRWQGGPPVGAEFFSLFQDGGLCSLDLYPMVDRLVTD
jgi:hypothetical protein